MTLGDNKEPSDDNGIGVGNIGMTNKRKGFYPFKFLFFYDQQMDSPDVRPPPHRA